MDKNGSVYLAMDPDREGEAIAYHASKALKLKAPKRVSFNEITKDAVTKAMQSPRDIDMDLVDAQFGRRILDRLVGYKVSEVLWKKMWYGLSAGRVQSAALRLIVEREDEIDAFVPKEYWDMFVDLISKEKEQVRAKFARKNGKKFVPKDEKEVLDIKEQIEKKEFEVVDIKKKEVRKHAYPPFTTSTLQQTANSVLGLTAKRTMGIAQSLYQSGYITYMRTDSVNLSSQAIDSIRSLIISEFGDKYLPKTPNFYKTRSRNAQEAHEAIRPSDISVRGKDLKDLDAMSKKLYDLIWNRTVSCQMEQRVVERISAEIEPVGTKDKLTFTLGAEKVIFDGFRRVLGSGGSKDEDILVEIEKIAKGDKFKQKELISEQKFTLPKARYSEASLVKALEALGIGRPSTYATIISTVQDRGYVTKDGKMLAPTDIGRVVVKFLKSSFERLVDYEYTAGVEQRLDDIAEGKLKYLPFMKEEYGHLVKDLEKAEAGVKKEDVVVLGKSDEKCDICKKDMVIKIGRYGKFISCSDFPECKGIKNISNEGNIDTEKFHIPKECPKCASKMILKSGKYGQFWACEKYPECKGVLPMLLNEKCPECQSMLVERKGRWGKMFTGCSGYPDCKYIKKQPKKSEEE